jgi:acyl carrier protein
MFLSTATRRKLMTHSAQQILDTVRDILMDVAGVAPEDVHPDRTLVDDLGIDSLTLVEVAAAVQDTFEVEVPDEGLVELRTVGDVIALVQQVVAA